MCAEVQHWLFHSPWSHISKYLSVLLQEKPFITFITIYIDLPILEKKKQKKQKKKKKKKKKRTRRIPFKPNNKQRFWAIQYV